MRALRVVQQRTAAICERVRAAVASELSGELDVIAAARRAHAEMDAEAARAIARDPSQPPACSAGCAHCCHVHVDATRGEVLAVARHLIESRSAEALATLIERLTAQVNLVSGLDHDQRWRAQIPCAMLGDDGKCTIYDVRPLRCRAFHSSSVDACREAFAGGEPALETNLTIDRACDAAEQGYDRALEERGLSAAPVLLEPSLLDALTDAAVARSG